MTAPTPTHSRVYIAGVAWPVYKLVALAVGVVVFALVGLVTMTLGPAVVVAAAAATATWLTLGRVFSAKE